MKSLLVYLKNYVKESVFAPLFKLLEASFELIVPLVIAAIIDKGIVEDEKSVILVENGRFYGMGYLPMDYKMRDLDMIKSSIRPMPENSYISHLLFDFAKKFPKKILHFSNTLIPHF